MFDVLFTDLSKAFYCLSHDLLAAKLSAADVSAVRIISDYFNNWKQRPKIEDHYSSWGDLIFRVPQGSTLGPLLLTFI